MFFRKKEALSFPYDPSRHTAVLRSSICTGEKTAGFRDKETGVFHEERLIRDGQDLEEFKRTYGITEIKTEY